jgi:signal transduction histidine kinase
MHDGLAQEIAALGYELHRIERVLRTSEAEFTAAQLHDLRLLVQRLAGGMRLAMLDLRAGVRPDRGLIPALSAYLTSVEQATGIAVAVDLQDRGFRLDGDIEETLFRVVHECVGWVRAAGVPAFRVHAAIDPPQATLRLSADPALWSDAVHAHWLDLQAQQHGLAIAVEEGDLSIGIATTLQEAAA